LLQASLKKWDDALADAEKCVELKPDWAKGYSRLGGALYGKRKFEDAVGAYKKGLAIDDSNASLQSGLKEAEAALAGPGARA
jgi:stress-induced-phosphoprotein 1